METRIQKWGNSDGIRIPSNILKSLNIKTNDILNIEQDGEKIIITVPKKKKISLEEKFKLPEEESISTIALRSMKQAKYSPECIGHFGFKEYHGKNLAKEFSWDENIGREIW